MDAREQVLARIRAALGAGPSTGSPAIPRDYRTRGEHPPGAAELLDLLADRLGDYRAEVRRCSQQPGAIGDQVAAALAARGARRIGVPSGLPEDYLAGRDGAVLTGCEVLRDGPDAPLDVPTLDGLDAVLTGCAVAVAETGTLILDGSADQGRRALTLVPDYHLVVVRAGQVVQTVPEALSGLDPRRPLTMISGPSATSDIELTRVEGVHGPRTLVVVLAG